MIKRSYTARMGLVSYWAQRVLEFWQSVEATRFTDLARDVLRAERAMWLERRVIVIGAPGSGKSSLAAGLLGSELPLRAPMEGTCVRWRFACSDGDVSDSRFLPREELEGIEVIDTADCADPACAARIEELFERTDVLIAAMDCRRMDESPCWPLLQKAEDSVGVVILAITFMDQVGREELLRIKGSIRKLCHDRLHGHPVALIVSPNAAESREAFAENVQEALDGPSGVRRQIRETGHAAADLNKSVCDVLDNRARVMSSNADFLNSIETEISNFRSHQLADIPQWKESFARAFDDGLPRLLRRLRFSFGFLFSPVTIVRLDQFARATELASYRALVQDIWRHLTESDESFVASCEAHWRSVKPRMLAAMDYEMGEFPAQKLMLELQKVRSHLVRRLYRPFSEARMRRRFHAHFNRCIPWMMHCLRVICSLLLVAGVFGYFGQMAVASACMGGAFLVWLLATLGQWVASRRLRREVSEDMREFSPMFAASLSGALEEFLLMRVTAYRQLYNEPRLRIAHFEKTLEPLRARYPVIRDQLSGAMYRL